VGSSHAQIEQVRYLDRVQYEWYYGLYQNDRGSWYSDLLFCTDHALIVYLVHTRRGVKRSGQ
jgi:hypothetical protein